MRGKLNKTGAMYDMKLLFTLVALVLFAILLPVFAINNRSVADNTSPWLGTDNPYLEKIADIPSNYQFPTVVAGIDCYEGEVRVSIQSSHTGCLNRLLYGRASSTGYLYLNGDSRAAKFENYSNNLNPLGVPNSTTVLSTGSSLMRFTKNVTSSLTTTNNSDGTVRLKVNRPPDALLRDKAGNNLNYEYDTIFFSNDGKWMVVDSPNRAMLRVNLETFEVLPFRAPFVYGTGFHPGTQMAITNDGRHVAVRSISSFEIFDLSTCAAVPDTITGPVACEKKSLLEFIRSQEGSDASPPGQLEFIDSHTISFVLRHGTSTPMVRSKYLMSADGHTTSRANYLALGDSFASGHGAGIYEAGTDEPENRCRLSTRSYPYLIANDLNINTFHSVACSGATSSHILDDLQYPAEPNPNPLGIWLPGQYSQLTHVARSQPDVITVSIIGNDLDFDGRIAQCVRIGVTSNTCYATYGQRKALLNDTNSRYTTLKDVFNTLKTQTNGTTKIYVMGYPQIAREDSPYCGVNLRLNNDEVRLANRFVDHINYVVEQAALTAGVTYVDVGDALYGHRLCDHGTNKGIHGLNLGRETPASHFGPASKDSYHPNELGHKLLRDRIRTATQDFTVSNPTPVSVNPPDDSSATAQALLHNLTPTNETVRTPSHEPNMLDDFIYKNTVVDVHMTNVVHGLKPNTSYEVELHSTPRPLGTFTTDSEGTLDFSVTTPGDIDAGFHTVHILGKNMTGEDIDIYKTTYIAHSEEDYDGDGVHNDVDPCMFSEQSGIDEDEDGIDDACDGYIDFSPTKVSQLYRARNGDPAKAEPTDKVFIERNVQVAEELFGLDDHDADSDSWSIVAESDSSIYGSVGKEELKDIGLTIDVTDRFVPYVSIRHPAKGCVRLTPEILSEVIIGQTRPFKIMAEDTDTCRSEPPETDTDNDGTPDELQPLYRARNGNILSGEDPFRIYIERNLVAAEAVLGQSDYDADGDGWAVVGVSDTMLGTLYNRVILADSSGNVLSQDGAFTLDMLSTLDQLERRQIRPIALYRTLLLQCEAVEPDSLTTIKAGENRAAGQTSGFGSQCN
jgi:hypothetical protein